MNQSIEALWDGLPVVRLEAGTCRALLAPSLGSNLLSLELCRNGSDLQLLRSPGGAKALREDPFAFGIPILCPPNRIAGASYAWDGVTYRFPPNGANGMHLHGLLHCTPWRLAGHGADADSAWAVTETDSCAGPLRDCFPVDLAFRLHCIVTPEGLTQRFTVQNRSGHTVPFGLAYHTALNAVFRRGGSADRMRLYVPVSGCCPDRTENRFPTGEAAPLDERGMALAGSPGVAPLAAELDDLYRADPNLREAVLRDLDTGLEVVYRAGPDVGYWIVWNRGGGDGFVAVEPQTCLSNAFHLPDPERHGVILLRPGASWTGETSLLVRCRRA